VNRLSKESDVYWLITKELAPKFELLDCVIYLVNMDKSELTQILEDGDKIIRQTKFKTDLFSNLVVM